jgi:hypothetical protein
MLETRLRGVVQGEPDVVARQIPRWIDLYGFHGVQVWIKSQLATFHILSLEYSMHCDDSCISCRMRFTGGRQ